MRPSQAALTQFIAALRSLRALHRPEDDFVGLHMVIDNQAPIVEVHTLATARRRLAEIAESLGLDAPSPIPANERGPIVCSVEVDGKTIVANLASFSPRPDPKEGSNDPS